MNIRLFNTQSGENDRDRTHNRFLLLALLAVLVPGIAGAMVSNAGWKAVFPTFLLGITSSIVGGFFGFLFGMPRHRGPEEINSSDSSLPDNTKPNDTNLSEISDWVTKIIVGVGLIEARGAADLFYRLIRGISKDLGVSSTVLCGLLVLGAFVLGFFIAYFWVRLDFPNMLQSVIGKIADTQNEVDVNRAEMFLNLKLANSAFPLLPSIREKNMRDLDEFISKSPLHKRAVLLRARYEMEVPLHVEDRYRAINILQKYIDEKQAKKQTTDDDYADVLYNMSCYTINRYNESTDPVAKQSFLQKGAELLSQAINVSSRNKRDALEDPDFQGVLDTPEFQKLLS